MNNIRIYWYNFAIIKIHPKLRQFRYFHLLKFPLYSCIKISSTLILFHLIIQGHYLTYPQYFVYLVQVFSISITSTMNRFLNILQPRAASNISVVLDIPLPYKIAVLASLNGGATVLVTLIDTSLPITASPCLI